MTDHDMHMLAEYKALCERQSKTIDGLSAQVERGFNVPMREALRQRDEARAECDRLRARVAELTRELAETATARDEAVDYAVKQRRLHATPKSARFTITADDLAAVVEAEAAEGER